jgi:hypothetical protein
MRLRAPPPCGEGFIAAAARKVILHLPPTAMMRPMTEARSAAHWSGVPRFSQLSLAALLRLIAMLLVHVAHLFRMNPSRRRGECHTSASPQALPGSRRDQQEIKPTGGTNRHHTRRREFNVPSSSGLTRGSWFSTRRNSFDPAPDATGILGSSPRMTAVEHRSRPIRVPRDASRRSREAKAEGGGPVLFRKNSGQNPPTFQQRAPHACLDPRLRGEHGR